MTDWLHLILVGYKLLVLIGLVSVLVLFTISALNRAIRGIAVFGSAVLSFSILVIVPFFFSDHSIVEYFKHYLS